MRHLVQELYSKRVVDSREREEISSAGNSFKQNEVLLSIISRKSSKSYDNFLVALRESGQKHIVQRLGEDETRTVRISAYTDDSDQSSGKTSDTINHPLKTLTFFRSDLLSVSTYKQLMRKYYSNKIYTLRQEASAKERKSENPSRPT